VNLRYGGHSVHYGGPIPFCILHSGQFLDSNDEYDHASKIITYDTTYNDDLSVRFCMLAWFYLLSRKF